MGGGGPYVGPPPNFPQLFLSCGRFTARPQSAQEDRHQEERTHSDGLHLASLLERRGVATHHSGIYPYSRSKGWFATPHPKRYNPATHGMSLTRADQHPDLIENRYSLVYLLCESGRLEEKNRMALKGNLRDFNVTQLLNLINIAQKTGTLTVEGPDAISWVSFRAGKLIYAQMGNEDGSLTGILTRAGKITSKQANVIKENATEKSDQGLGLLLINAGYLSQQVILDSIQQYALDIVYQLFTWIDGLFRFDNDVLPPSDAITVRMDLENIIMEGSRQTQEWELLKDEIPSLEMALTFVDRPGADIRDVQLTVDEWKVVSYINPKNTLKQIGKTNRMNDLEIRRIVYGLVQAGLVEIIRPEGMPLPPKAKIPPVDKKQQASLVNKLIHRIRSL